MVLVGLGSNRGERQEIFQSAITKIAESEQVTLVRVSRFYQSIPSGGPPQEMFLNAAVLLETSLSPIKLLDQLQLLELELGRKRTEFWGPRTIDLDILLFGREIISTSRLTIPHPRFYWRSFALEPANEIAPFMLHPQLGQTVRDLWHLYLLVQSYSTVFSGM